MKHLLAMALLLAPVPAASATRVEVADGNWSYLPLMKQRGSDHLNNDALARIDEIVHARQCTFPGQKGPHYDVTVSFAAHFAPDGSLDRLVMTRLNCPEVEGLVGGVLLEMIQAGDYRPTGANANGWYRGELSFGGKG
ncbi:hypothetical protein [Sphingomonas sp.]|uniref:hypothetical protein n=1 Tax=Sphingomonas sp. TaxID=28214 RepID=UPI0018017E59|nr:hypothetical protein [Sphingomonas sp.]MBA3511511.1 hypothetical protein [Sphingomonas sp.]